MWKDEIVEEVHQYREAYAAKFNFNLQAIYHDLKNRAKKQAQKSFL